MLSENNLTMTFLYTHTTIHLSISAAHTFLKTKPEISHLFELPLSRIWCYVYIYNPQPSNGIRCSTKLPSNICGWFEVLSTATKEQILGWNSNLLERFFPHSCLKCSNTMWDTIKKSWIVDRIMYGKAKKKTFVLKKTMGKGEKFNPLYFGSPRLVVRLFLLCSSAPQTYCSSRDWWDVI